MSKTVVRKNESLDDALRRFKRSVTKAGTLQESRKREFYEKPSVKRKRKSEAANVATSLGKQNQEDAEEDAAPTQEELLTEIRDLLKEK